MYRLSRPYIRWLQVALNEAMGIRLEVDGNLGPETRRAVARFEELHGRPVSGTVGPFVECELIQAVAINPSGSSAQTPAFATTQSLRQRVTQLAVQGWVRWGEGTIEESDPAFLPVLEDYWCTGVQVVPEGPQW